MQEWSRLAPARIWARLGLVVLVVAGLIGIGAPAQAAGPPFTAFTLDSETGDSIGAGHSFTFTDANATITATGDDTALTMTVTDGTDNFSADLTAPTGATLTAGFYTTTRVGDATNAGLDVSGDGRACGSSIGTMTVHEISLDGSNALATLAVTYEQHCEGAAPALFGELRFNSSIDYKAVSASPASIDFGTRPRTPSAPNAITITNTGSTALTFGTASIKGTAGGLHDRFGHVLRPVAGGDRNVHRRDRLRSELRREPSGTRRAAG